MTAAGIREQLAEAAAGPRLVTLTRQEPLPEHRLYVLPLALGSELLLCQVVNPDLLLPDGFSVLRLADAAEVRSRAWERVVERALADEARLPSPDAIPALPLDGWPAVLAELRARRAGGGGVRGVRRHVLPGPDRRAPRRWRRDPPHRHRGEVGGRHLDGGVRRDHLRELRHPVHPGVLPPRGRGPVSEAADTTVLWRPVGQAELELIERSGWRAFPPYLLHQPFSHPV